VTTIRQHMSIELIRERDIACKTHSLAEISSTFTSKRNVRSFCVRPVEMILYPCRHKRTLSRPCASGPSRCPNDTSGTHKEEELHVAIVRVSSCRHVATSLPPHSPAPPPLSPASYSPDPNRVPLPWLPCSWPAAALPSSAFNSWTSDAPLPLLLITEWSNRNEGGASDMEASDMEVKVRLMRRCSICMRWHSTCFPTARMLRLVCLLVLTPSNIRWATERGDEGRQSRGARPPQRGRISSASTTASSGRLYHLQFLWFPPVQVLTPSTAPSLLLPF
jgi:hypothetical protein